MKRVTSTFELPSAKNLTVVSTVEMFVPTDLFWELMSSDGHDVVFGTRGSGKTMLLRMMSVQHLIEFSKYEPHARAVLWESKRFGIFLPLGIDWCVAYQRDDDSCLQFFIDGVNLVAADALVDALDCLLNAKVLPSVEPCEAESILCDHLVSQWFRPLPSGVRSFLALRTLLLRQQAILRDVWRNRSVAPSDAEERDAGYFFRSGPLLSPIADGVRLANTCLNLPTDHKWLVCLDELEDLKPAQMRTVATLLRSATSNLVLKITTQPYTLDGTDTRFSEYASAVDFRDFEVRRLQHDPEHQSYRDLVAGILRKRIAGDPKLPSEKLLANFFGDSTFVDRATETNPGFLKVKQAILKGSDNADSARKKLPVAALRTLKRDAERGNKASFAYSGWQAIVRISDGNPGMFVRILNGLRVGRGMTSVDSQLQHIVLSELATVWHDWSQALYSDGQVLYDLITLIGNQLSRRIHSQKMPDVEVSQEINRFLVDLAHVDESHVRAFHVGARHSLLVAESLDSSLRYPDGKGVWRLSYALAPKFWLLPRRGRTSRLAPERLAFSETVQSSLQLHLFELDDVDFPAEKDVARSDGQEEKEGDL